MKTKIKSLLFIALGSFAFQSCTHDVYVDPDAAAKAAYAAADAVNGSKLFSNFLHVDAGWPLDDAGWPDVLVAADPTINIADISNPPRGVVGQSNANFYSCTGCHAVDGIGRDGMGITKVASKTAPEFAASHLLDNKNDDIIALFNKIKNVGGRQIDPAKTANGLDNTLGGQAHPDYSKILTDAKIWDLVKWVKEGMYNENSDLYTITTTGVWNTLPKPTVAYSNLGGAAGNPSAGVAFYSAKCTVCHAADGAGTTDAQGPVMAPGVKNQTTGSGATNPATGKKEFGLGPYFRYNTASGVFVVVTGKFGNVPWMAATPTTKQEMKDMLAAFRDTKRFPALTTQRPNP